VNHVERGCKHQHCARLMGCSQWNRYDQEQRRDAERNLGRDQRQQQMAADSRAPRQPFSGF